MSINNTKAASSAPETAEIRSLIINELARWHANEDALETAIPGVILYRFSAPTALAPIFYEPRISMALQGTKRVVLGDEEYVSGENRANGEFFLCLLGSLLFKAAGTNHGNFQRVGKDHAPFPLYHRKGS
jgi:hypothetical protein